MDVLSEVLKAVELSGAVYLNGEFSEPWGLMEPCSSTLAEFLQRQQEHVIVYHLLVEGRAWIRLLDGATVTLTAGDIVAFPHGDAHAIGNGVPTEIVDQGKDLQEALRHGLSVVRSGGGGEISRFICGFLTCAPDVSSVVLRGLPPLLRVNIRRDETGVWLENALRFTVANAAAGGAPGTEAFLTKLSEALFIETLRRYMAEMPQSGTGWLAGARDPQIGRALAALHSNPARPWSVADLAHEAGLSRSVFADRFRHFLGEPPMVYLMRWRLRLGARMLREKNLGVAEVSIRVGYDSEAAFNRAFKREFGMPPAKYRTGMRAAAAAS